MVELNIEEVEFLVELLNKYPTESLRKIAELEGIDYYKLKRLYDRYYGEHVQVNAMYDIAKLGLRSYVAFLSVPQNDLRFVAHRMYQNPFIVHQCAIFGFKNGINAVLHIPKEQIKYIDEMLTKYSEDYEYYEVRAYPPAKKREFGEWRYSYDYAVLMDILKWDARTPMKEISKMLGKTRPTIRYMINKLKEDGILTGFFANIEVDTYDRGVLGITSTLDEAVLERFRDYEIMVGVLDNNKYIFEWFFSSKEDLGTKLFEFSNYVEKVAIEYFDLLADIEKNRKYARFSKMVKKDGSGYRSILEF
ncbi:Lrp/AsnC family transcriptional regulator [Thermococcus sp. CX2]|uniref:Lrp/AsnC family transcriptional regulator n=1 Tax=Thermococcus sp. CX2 TaxID=163006 RepID=UPI0014393014|nr:Lrp/AsnC family transcriptional regulator [Thermococcus sp. CX2]NJE85412.1 Lrp/AsnC family transcriptional regulator [Thermococcus sp. CX2]